MAKVRNARGLSPDVAGPRHRTLAETAAAELHQMIMSGELPPGSPLRLVELAEQLGMSNMPVREGLRRLEALGMVEIIPHKGAWVRELSEEDLLDTHQTRLALETLAVRMAAERFTAADAEAAVAALDEHARLSQSGQEVAARRAHTEFHFAIYRGSGSVWLPRAIEPVWENYERYRFAGSLTPARLEQMRCEHQAILDACVAHDVAEAEAALCRHLEGAMERITRTMKDRMKASEKLRGEARS
ncbi:GntR family transcriptional regulator [Planosporangium sp. 12N6]|uniref:GntR family transcriptional regulator n=1 Tax=Planosporangium spinosum TaxID=3402278 RepID=UPI003CF5E88A